jgi:hypothetical protein
MNNQEQIISDNINDLNVTEAEQAEIKGGPKKIFIGGLSVRENATMLPDLEPNGDVKGGMLLPAVQKVR